MMLELDQFTKLILSNLSVGIIIVDPLRRIWFANDSALELLDKKPPLEETVCHRSIWNSDNPCPECPLEPNGQNPFVGELEVQKTNTIIEVHAKSSDARFVVETLKDISLLKHFQRELEDMALIDTSSGLLKRQFIREHLQKEIHRGHRAGESLSLILIRVHDLGHDDISSIPKTIARMLRGIGEVLGKETRSYDLTYRFDPDTFAVILPNEDIVGATHATNRILDRIKKLGIENTKAGVASLGQSAIAETLIYAAQQALYRAEHSEDNIATN